jgi:hypothetical protein
VTLCLFSCTCVFSQVLRSFELLALRRNRMCKRSSGDIDRNQSIVIAMPGFFKRLLTLLRIANHGPTVTELVNQDIQMPSALSAEFFMYMNQSRRISEWDHFDSLEETLRAGDSRQQSTSTTAPTTSTQSTSVPNVTLRDVTASAFSNSINSASATASALSTAATSILSGVGEGFMPTDITDSAYFGLDEMNSDDEDMLVDMETRAAADVATALQQPNVSVNQISAQVQESLLNMLQAMQPSLQMGSPSAMRSGRSGQVGSSAGLSSTASASTPSPSEAAVNAARNELNFQALSLAPHQVELLFVLCTLLSGRRKIDVQKQ